ncbi:MAG: MAC/perforin domain-containing protein [Bacteroides sp.]
MMHRYPTTWSCLFAAIRQTAGLVGLLLCSMNSVLTTSCSSDLASNEPDQPIDIPTEQSTQLRIVDAQGRPITTLANHYHQYYVEVNVALPWQLTSDTPFLYPAISKGNGPARIPLLVADNWSAERSGNLHLHVGDATTRSTDGNVTVKATQDPNDDVEKVKNLLSSNKGAGYAYLPNSNYCLGTSIQVFNMVRLDSLQKQIRYTLLTDEYYPQVEEEIMTAKSQEDLADKLSIAASVNLNFRVFSIEVKGSYGSEESSSTTKEYAIERLKSYQFTREVDYMNIVSLVQNKEVRAEDVFAPGFLFKRKELTDAIHNAKSSSEKEKLCADFCEDIGPCFINKSVLGCVMDYYISVDKSLLTNGMTVSGALKIKVHSSFNLDIEGSGEFQEQAKKINEQTEAKINIRGGNVNKVCILATGGTLSNTEVKEWQLSVTPSTAVMIDMKLVPIYVLFDDYEAYAALKAYVDKKAALGE